MKTKPISRLKGTGGRQLHVPLKTARGRRVSSQRWLQRQLNDPYVIKAKLMGYRSRAAFKLLEINERFDFLKPGMNVVDIGAAPGGWSQVVVGIVNPEKSGSKIIAVDLQEIEPMPFVEIEQMDFMDEGSDTKMIEMLGGKQADIVLSDMAASSTGHAKTDHIKIMVLANLAFDFAEKVLAPEGVFVAKVLQGGTESELLKRLKESFKIVKHVKPPSSRKDSSEMYVFASGFKK